MCTGQWSHPVSTVFLWCFPAACDESGIQSLGFSWVLLPACLPLILLCDVYLSSPHFLPYFPFLLILTHYNLFHTSSQLLGPPNKGLFFLKRIGTAWIHLPMAEESTAVAVRGWYNLLFSEQQKKSPKCRTCEDSCNMFNFVYNHYYMQTEGL